MRHRESLERREFLLKQARERLAADPEKLGRFDELYDMARHYLAVTEDHNFYIDQVGNAVLRLPILEIGGRLAARGGIAGPRRFLTIPGRAATGPSGGFRSEVPRGGEKGRYRAMEQCAAAACHRRAATPQR